MINNLQRIGNFTSSEISKLMSSKTRLTYIAEKNWERKLGRSLRNEIDSRPMIWGKFCEERIFDILDTEYTHTSKETKVHPYIPFWAGSKDGLKHDEGKTVYDFKAPTTHKSFCNLVDPIYEGLTGLDAMKSIRHNHSSGDSYYWQLVSNSCIDDTKFAELIVYMPYLSELNQIREQANQAAEPNLYWIWSASDEELPYLLDGGYYRNINIIRFEVPVSDKEFLTNEVRNAGLRLIDPKMPPKQQSEKENGIAIDPISFLKKID